MKKKTSVLIVLLMFHIGILYANDYYWDLINALIYGDFQKAETIINENNLTVSLEGRTIEYRMDSNESFSGNGQLWARTGN